MLLSRRPRHESLLSFLSWRGRLALGARRGVPPSYRGRPANSGPDRGPREVNVPQMIILSAGIGTKTSRFGRIFGLIRGSTNQELLH